MIAIGMSPAGGGGGSKGSISVAAYSDAGLTTPITTANYGDTIYINAVVSGLTPTQYSFSLTNGTKSQTFNQAGATLTYVVEQFGTLTVAASARDGSTGVSVAATSTLTVSVAITKSLKFDGVNDLALAIPVIDNDQDFSVTMWFKLNSLSLEQLFSFTDFNNNARLSLTVYYDSDKIYALYHFDGWNFNRNVAWTGDTEWHHLTFTYDVSAAKREIYIDGVYIGDIQRTGVDLLTGRFDKFVLAVGYNYTTYGNVNIADAAIHDTPLTQAEITAMQTIGVASGHEVWRLPIIEPVGTTSGFLTDIIGGQKMRLRGMTTGYGVVADIP